MNRNPIIPFSIIAVVGILLMMSMSFYGVNKADELAAGEDGHGEGAPTEEVTDPEAIYAQSCAMCHGQNLEGVAGPGLANIGGKLTVEEINGVITNGQGTMPGGLVDAAKAEILAQWLAEKK